MPEARFRGWQFLEKLEPWGDRRIDFGAALVASVIANSNRDASKTAWKPSDFIPDWDAEPEPVNREAMIEADYIRMMLFKEGYDRQRSMQHTS